MKMRTIIASMVTALVCVAAYAGDDMRIHDYPLITQPVVPPAPAPAPQHQWAVEFSLANVFATHSLLGEDTKRFNLGGPEVTGVYALDKNHAFTLRSSFLFGRHSHACNVHTPLYTYDVPLAKFDWRLMPGYRYTYELCPQMNVYAGVNAGFLFTDVQNRHKYKTNGGGAESSYGLAGSVEVGFKYEIDDNWSVFASYEFSGDYMARPIIFDTKQRNQTYHGVRIGVGYSF